MNYKNVLYKRKRNKIVKDVMKELKLTLKDINQFVPFDEVKESMEISVRNILKKQPLMRSYDKFYSKKDI